MADWSGAPAILIFGDSEAGRAAAAEAAKTGGGRIAAMLPIEAAVERLDSQISVDLVILDVTIDHGPLLDRLLHRMEAAAAARQFAGIVTVSHDLLDIVFAQIGHKDIGVLVGRDRQALALAMADALDRVQPQLREPGDAGEAGRLHALTDRTDWGGRVLAMALDGENGAPADGDAPPDVGTTETDNLQARDAALIRGMIRGRRLRTHFLGHGLFADPAWDILLDLTAARIEGRSVAVSSLCIAAAVPATTALRWIKQLTEAGLLRRVADPVDGRRVFIELTDSAATAMRGYFAALSR